MDIIISLAMILAGLFMMVFGGNSLVDGAVSIAKKIKISEAIIGLTIVAVGTSVPELVVSILAALQGSADIAIGNVIGSNIANIYLILGITAIITPVLLKKSTRYFDLPVVIFTMLLLLAMVSDVLLDGHSANMISRVDGIIFLVFATLYIIYSVIHQNFVPDESEKVEKVSPPTRAIIGIIGGIAVLFIGGQMLVNGAVTLAKMAGISEAIIGLTIVAIGTSAPEMVTSIVAARRGNPDIAVGNVVGSCIMNVFVILGISALIVPMKFQDASFVDLLVSISAPIMMLLLVFSFDRKKPKELTRNDGWVLVLIYLAYLGYLLYKELM